jgi:hypothetical protein
VDGWLWGDSAYIFSFARTRLRECVARVGLPQNAIPLALLFFNVAVEVGRLLFISSIMTVIVLSCSGRKKNHSIGGRAAVRLQLVRDSLSLYYQRSRILLADPTNCDFRCLS